jgi:exonuclease VII large subunit
VKVLERGYSLTFSADGRLLRSVAGLSPGDRIKSRLHRGEIVSEVVQAKDPPQADTEDSGHAG